MATNRMKALYAIMLPKRSNVPGVERTTEEVNEERLNDNFRTITNELVKLWEGGEHNLKVLSARVTSEEQVTASLVEQIGDVAADTVSNSAAILATADSIRSEVSQTLTGYALIGNMEDMENADEDTLAWALNAAQSYASTKVSQTASELTVLISANTTLLKGEDGVSGINKTVSDISGWVKIVGQVGTRKPGVIIGNSGSVTSDGFSASLKAEAGAIFFYKGDETNAWWENENTHVLNPNVLAGFDKNGNFIAGNIHNESTLLDGKFDIDVVTANGIDFLHITGRNT